MKRITSTDLANWTPHIDRQGHLPLLIRKLIRTENLDIQGLFFPSGDNIVLSGWDGRLLSNMATEYIPVGMSVWEIGTEKDFKGKIKKDYKGRTADPKGEIPSETTYIAVTPYVWPSKENWVEEKKAEKIWKDIRVIDGLVLEEWIEKSPIVSAWLSKHLGIYPNILPLDDFWDFWSNSSKHKISPTLVLSGRESASETLINLLQEHPSDIVIKSSTIEESIAFVAATIYKNDIISQEDILSRSAIIENEVDFRNILSQRRPLILIIKFEDDGIVERAIRNGHHVIIPVGFDTTSTKGDTINLPRIRRNGFENGLQEMGFDREKIEQLTKDSGQNLSVLRRILQFVKNQQPEWAKGNNYLDLIPALLIGGWDEQSQGDKDIIVKLANSNYEHYISKLSKWKLHKDAPIIQIGSIWRLTSSLDAWSILGPFLSKTDLEQFKTITCKVLSDINPSLNLEPDKRYMASIYKKENIYSHTLKDGLCKSLALISVFGDSFNINVVKPGQSFVDTIVYEILSTADGKRWCSLNHYIPLIAEASPDIFLKEIETALKKDSSTVLAMFQEVQNIIFPNSYHTGLLWGLENLAISSSYLMRVALILGVLSRLDPGGKLSNRPINSLRTIFIPWYIQTEASFEMRKTILKKLSIEEPDIAWDLFLSLLPNNHRSVSTISKCRWRFNEQHIEPSTTHEELGKFYSFLVNQLAQFNLDNERIINLIKILDNLNINDRTVILNTLRIYKEKSSDNNYTIWNELRKLVVRHRRYSNTNWALSTEEVKKIDDILKLYEPSDEIVKSIYLFEDSWIEIPERPRKRELPYEKEQELYFKMRKKALSNIYGNQGIEGLLSIVDKVHCTWIVGNTTAHLSLKEEESFTILLILSKVANSIARQDFAKAYIREKANIVGEKWVERQWRKIEIFLTTTEAKSDFFLSLPQNDHSWKLLNNTDPETCKMYWQKVSPWLYRSTLEERSFALAQLQKVNRHITVLDNAAHFIDELSSEMIESILYNIATIPSEETAHLSDYDVVKLFKTLKDKGEIEKTKEIQLEWLFIPFLTASHSECKPHTLLNELTNNPSFFVEVVSYVYIPDNLNDDNEVLTEEEKKIFSSRAESAYKLLECWYQIPGMNENKEIDLTFLMNWVIEARKLGAEKNRLRAIDSEIGKILAYYPRNNEFWPCEAICEVIDTINSQSLLDSFKTAIFNSRGVYSKSPYEGGDQERRLSAYFEKTAKLILPRWPLTASALQELAKGYAKDAIREDESARIDELR